MLQSIIFQLNTYLTLYNITFCRYRIEYNMYFTRIHKRTNRRKYNKEEVFHF